jgi:hypothetical protein
MQTQPWWLILVAPAAALLAVLIERVTSLIATNQEAGRTIDAERRAANFEYMKDEAAPILEFADQATLLMPYLIDAVTSTSLGGDEPEDLQTILNEITRKTAIASAHAHSFPHEVILAVDELAILVMTIANESRKHPGVQRLNELKEIVADGRIAQYESKEQRKIQRIIDRFDTLDEVERLPMSNDLVLEKLKRVPRLSGEIRRLVREYLLSAVYRRT